MKKIFTLLLALLLCGIAAQAQEAGYQPLVREGVVWHYNYFVFVDLVVGGYSKEMKVQFKGDTLISGVSYKKCFLYETETLPDDELPICCAREDNGKVMFTQPRHEVLDTLGSSFSNWDIFIPGESYEENGEIIVYDFGDMSSFIDSLHGEIVSTTDASVNGMPVKKYSISVYGAYECDFVEGVGVDGEHAGLLFAPLVMLMPGFSSEPMGLIKLTDLDGNVLYKGASYDDSHDGLAKVEVCGERLRVRQSATTVLVDVPTDGMLSVFDMAGHVVTSGLVAQGTAEIPAGQLAAGVYIVQLSTATGTQTAKVVVQ